MSALFVLLLCFLFLYLSQRLLTSQLSYFVHRLGGTRKTMIIVWSLIFLPGTILHELSHFFMAILVGARTGKIEILPEYLEDDNSGVALGSVQTQKLNIVQGVLVGLAPLFSGLICLFVLSNQILTSYQNSNIGYLALQIYLFFVISNSFFPSKTDLSHAIPAFITFIILLLILYLAGIAIPFKRLNSFDGIITSLTYTVTTSSILNLVISFFLYMTKSVFLRQK